MTRYGIWPWLLEESLEQMSPPDWNWADFIGARLAQILVEFGPRLPESVRNELRISLGHAAWSIFRRNIKSNYTNIAIMGGGVTVAAGEILAEPRLVDYGRQRLADMVAYIQEQGNFNEYNSPTYTIVAIHESERILQIVVDPASRSSAEWIRNFAWQTVGSHYHLQTSQWAPPHSRAYHDHLTQETTAYLSRSTGIPILVHDGGNVANKSWSPIRHLSAPAEVIEIFRSVPSAPVVLKERFVRCETDEKSLYATTWLSEKVCLGSMNQSIFWARRRPLQGYLWTPADSAVVLRVRGLNDGRDFCTLSCRNAQDNNRVLTIFNVTRDRGDFHPLLSRPKDGIFRARDLRFRYQLAGRGVTIEKSADESITMAAGMWRLVIHPAADGRFGNQPIRWVTSIQDQQVCVDAIIYEGEPTGFSPDTSGPLVLAAGLEILAPNESPRSQSPIVFLRPDGAIESHWCEELQVIAPKVEDTPFW